MRPAERAPHVGCWMAWPKRVELWKEHIEGAREDYLRVAQAIARFEPVTMLADPADAADARLRCGPSVSANRNPGGTKAEAEAELRAVLGVQKVIWLPGDVTDTESDGHVDGFVAYVKPATILCEVVADSIYTQLSKRRAQRCHTGTAIVGISFAATRSRNSLFAYARVIRVIASASGRAAPA
jgi:agmatine/peptidylarginine deiminase